MTMKLCVGFSKKVGQPDFGSRGASCQLEIELDRQLLCGDPDEFERQVHQAFDRCRQAVDTEVSNSGGPANPIAPIDNHRNEGSRLPESVANGHSLSHRSGSPRGATPSQVRAIFAIANKRRLDLVAELMNRFNVSRPDELTIRQASEMIDAIKTG